MLGTPNIVGLPPFSKAVHNGNGHRRHHPREHMRGDVCCAALRAVAAATRYRDPQNAYSLADCALMHGTGVRYLRAAIALLKHDDPALIDAVVHGRINILAAAKPIEAEMRLVAAFQAASPQVRIAAGLKVGPGVIWDSMISPSLT
jgi:hypothetical protein